jgi:4-amino-4-deoxy-L-arabinose transferase-like glycosyltransferase
MERLNDIYQQLRHQLGISPRDRQVDRLWLLFWTIAAVFLYTWQLGNLPLRDWDEGIVAVVAREMSRSDWPTWLFPKWLNQLPYWNKPPLMHWLVASLYRGWGVNEWTTRLPGACLSALSVPLLYTLTRELLTKRLPAIFATGVFLTYLPMVRQGRLAMLDGAIVAFWLLTLNCVVRSRRDVRWSLGIGIGIGLLCLTKGLLGLLLGAIGILFLVFDTWRVLRSGYFWAGLFLGLLPVVGWYSLQYWHYGWVYLQAHFFDQALDRVAQSVEHNGQPPWFYLWEILKFGAIWLVFLPWGLQLWWRDRRLSWAKLVGLGGGGYFGIISMMQTKLPWYAMPLYPAIAIVVGVALAELWQPSQRFLQQGIRLPYQRGWAMTLGVLLLPVVGSLIYHTIFSPILSLAVISLLLAITLFVAIFLILQKNREFILILIWGTYLSLFALMSSQKWIWELAEQYPVRPVAALVQQYTQPHQPVYTTFPLARPSLEFYSDRQIIPTTQTQLQTLSAYQALVAEPNQLKGTKALGQMAGWSIVTKLR